MADKEEEAGGVKGRAIIMEKKNIFFDVEIPTNITPFPFFFP